MATDVATDVVVIAMFDVALQGSTLTPTAFTLKQTRGETVDGAVSLQAERTAVLKPERPLALLVAYTVTLSTDIESLSGQRLEADLSWVFTTREGRWNKAEPIEMDDEGDAISPQVAIGPHGNALAVWEQSDGARQSIWATGYTPADGWGTAERVDSDDVGRAFHSRVAVDPDGNALAVWSQEEGTRFNIWANRRAAANGWGTAVLIEMNDAGNALRPQVAIDPDGNALAVWEQDDGVRRSIWANRYTPADGWGTAETVETNDTGDARNAQIAIDPQGNALAVWEQDGSIWANRYALADGWGTAEIVETNDTGDARNAQIAIDPQGNVLAVWEQDGGTIGHIWANRYTLADGWATAEPIEMDDAGRAFDAQIAMDAEGNALAVWYKDNGTIDNIWANRYTPADGWGTAEIVETNDTGDARNAQVAVDPQGNALAVWEQDDGTRDNIWSNRYTLADGWGTAELIESDDTGRAFIPQVAIDPEGNALAVWAQRDGTRSDIWANRFD